MKHVTDLLGAFVADELGPQERAEVVAHLAECPRCAAEAREARDLWDLLGDAALPTPEVTKRPSLWPGIQARTFGRDEQRRQSAGRRWTTVALATAAVAAGLGLAVILPLGTADKGQLAVSKTDNWGSGFWLDARTESTFSDLWLAAADEGSGS